MWESVRPYREAFEEFLRAHELPSRPRRLYDPLRAMLRQGGKRIRPVLTLVAAEGYGTPLATALPAAAAVELFHNFTLIHDDIMDDAPLRRGQPTVHRQWGMPVAILSGDVLMFYAQKFLEPYPPAVFQALQTLLNDTAIAVCEGQQADMDFEDKNEVSREEYMEMIRKKTAALMGTALRYGAILGERNRDEQEILYEAGIKLGLTFQILDDYLDTFGDEKFGKQTGGDIRAGKKTFLYVTLLEKLPPDKRKEFVELYGQKNKTEENVRRIVSLFRTYNLPYITRQTVEDLTREFIFLINSSRLMPEHKQILIHLAEDLAGRTV
ncbi:MAG: polyprenyl synthetase family protein [Chlorobi bacterium]|nr:polyprenyl synthetase family protein [Chlorobiota bacterium]